MLTIQNTGTNTIYATTISDCVTGGIKKTEFWNMRRVEGKYEGFWQNENNVRRYLKLGKNGSLFVSIYTF